MKDNFDSLSNPEQVKISSEEVEEGRLLLREATLKIIDLQKCN
jgi:hypothetical protein